VVAAALVFLTLAGVAQAQTRSLLPSQVEPRSLPALRTALAQPQVLREAVARQRVAPQTAGRRGGRRSSSATKATAAAALGLVGFFVGFWVGGLTAYGLRMHSSDGQTVALTTGVAGAVGGGYLGYWLASR
jgi:uncharacterized membrane protein